MMDAGSIGIERLFSNAKRVMRDDRYSTGNTFFEAILMSKANPDHLLSRSKKYFLDHINERLIMNKWFKN